MPPIQAHNWEKEDRRTLEEMASFLSAMDFLRLLRNEDLGIERIKLQTSTQIFRLNDYVKATGATRL